MDPTTADDRLATTPERLALASIDRLIVGLGNHGLRYEATRHTAGFLVVEALADRVGWTDWREACGGRLLVRHREAAGRAQTVGLLLPQTYMNESGRSLAAALSEAPGLDASRALIVVYDDLDLPLGRIRLRPRGGSGGHRGVASIAQHLQGKDFARLRFGIDRPPAGLTVVGFGLEVFTGAECEVLGPRIEVAVDALLAWLDEGIEVAMDRFNRADA